MEHILNFEKKSTVVVDIDELADELERSISIILYDYQGLTDDEIEVVDLDAVKKEVARNWLGILT